MMEKGWVKIKSFSLAGSAEKVKDQMSGSEFELTIFTASSAPRLKAPTFGER